MRDRVKNIQWGGEYVSQRRPSVEELIQRIDQLLNVLNMIREDLQEISELLRGVGPPTVVTPTPAEGVRTVEEVRGLFPEELGQMLTFEEERGYIIIKPRQYLGSENFAKIASIVRGSGGEYISAGKESHFRVSKETR